jgi:hypothetical protein
MLFRLQRFQRPQQESTTGYSGYLSLTLQKPSSAPPLGGAAGRGFVFQLLSVAEGCRRISTFDRE